MINLTHNKMIPAIERFRCRLLPKNSNGCILWDGPGPQNIYGVLNVNGRSISTHRYAWILAYGEIPPGLLVCHKCDVRRCVNPEHLFLGTYADNSQDMIKKGRRPKACDSANSKLTDEQVLYIRRCVGLKQDELAAMFGVSQTTIWRAKSGTAYRHVESQSC